MRAMNVHTGLLALAGVPAVAIIVLAGDPFLRLVYGEEFGASSLELFAFGTAALLCTLGYVNAATKIGRASCRERVWDWVVGSSVKKKKKGREGVETGQRSERDERSGQRPTE